VNAVSRYQDLDLLARSNMCAASCWFLRGHCFPQTRTATLAHVVVCRQGSSAKVSKTKSLAALHTSSISRDMMQIVSFRLEFADN